MLKVFAKENVCKCLFYIKSKKIKCRVWFCFLGYRVSLFLRTNHEEVLLEVEGPNFLPPLDLNILQPKEPQLLVMEEQLCGTYI